MENSFTTIKDTSSSYRIQVGMTFQSYVFPIPIVFQSMNQKSPMFPYFHIKSLMMMVMHVSYLVAATYKFLGRVCG
jgi:hypothetical protein